VQTCVTSPPYWGLRSYLPQDHPLKALEIGSEPTPEAFVQTMVDVFRLVRDALRDDGTLWLNLGDTYCDDTKWGGATTGRHPAELHGEPIGRRRVTSGIKPGDLLNMPHRVAAALQADGWYWRSTIVWAKRSPMPESVRGWQWRRCRVKVAGAGWNGDHPSQTDPEGERKRVGDAENWYGTSGGRVASPKAAKWAPCPGCDKCKATGGWVLRRGRWRPTTGHEYVFLLSKSAEYFCDGDAVQEMSSQHPADCKDGQPKRSSHIRGEFNGKNLEPGKEPFRKISKTRNPRSFWRHLFTSDDVAWCKRFLNVYADSTVVELSNEPYKQAHFATFPSELPRRCLLAGTSERCCGACGAPFAPVVESERVATRPGEDCKILAAHAQRTDIDPGTNWQHSTLNYGNRDPQRHVAVSSVIDHWPTCSCLSASSASSAVKSLVLDPFLGSGTTAQVARALGRDWIGCELSEAYAELARERIAKPPRFARQKQPRRTRSARMDGQGQLFTDEEPARG
jgi:DNA modification methylase